MKKTYYIKNFFKCGLCGWGFECFWTGLHSVLKRNAKELPCTTSVWMFPIYGLAAFIEPIYHLIKKQNVVIRGFVYTIFIFLTEYTTGNFLKKRGCCPWDYSNAKTNYKGIIRFDYAPLWFTVGLIYEKLIMSTKTIQ